jgi:FtsP/CotA-like multicopper oxidase with cupredoxin domain
VARWFRRCGARAGYRPKASRTVAPERRLSVRRLTTLAPALALIAGFLLVLQPAQGAPSVWSGLAISGPPTPDPYAPPPPIFDTDPGPNIETTLVADESTVDIGNGRMVHAQTYQSCSSVISCSGNGLIPGPTFRLDVGDTLTVRLVNHLSEPTGIHWHGAELANRSDGTPYTQNQVCGASAALGPVGGCTLLYKFKAFRPGIFWYHPHHHASTDQTFRGLYGMIIVRDPNEAALISPPTGPPVLPSAANTLPVVLSDITVCKKPATSTTASTNDPVTYSPSLPWVGGSSLPAQPSPTPKELCEDSPIDDNGNPRVAGSTPIPYAEGDVPSIQKNAGGRTNEGQTVLTNGVDVGGRAGTPSSPGAVSPTAYIKNVAAGQGLRLQLLNAAVVRYFRLRLTDAHGNQIQLVRIGGEGGLLDNAVVEGGVIGGTGGFDTQYGSGEILLPPGSRADVVAAIPTVPTVQPGDILTLWTEDYCRTGSGSPCGWPDTPTVPVMHLRVMGSASPTYSIAAGTQLRSSIPGQAVETLGPATGTLLNPVSFTPAKPGLAAQDIKLTQGGGGQGGLSVDNVPGAHEVQTTTANPTADYALAPHFGSTRYAKSGDILQLSVTNSTGAHHPIHLHGFSIQPLSLTKTGSPTYTWPYREFRDNVDIPPGYTLNFRLRVDPRPLADGTTPGGEYGRWLLHCHIFFHAVNGMIGELVVTGADGNEKPTVNVGGTWVYVAPGDTAMRHGTWHDPDGDPVTLTPTLGTVAQHADGTWDWSYPVPTSAASSTQYVYIKATDNHSHSDQVPFRLRIGGLDDGGDTGDPHLTTTNGKHYDFQAVGEFTLLRDFDSLEIQARQTPVATAAPILDPYSGLTSCVSINTAVAAQLLDHRLAFQPIPGAPSETGKRLAVLLDGRAADIGQAGLNLGPGARVIPYPLSNGARSYEIDYPDSTVLTVTPWFWDAHQVWLLNVSISRTPAYLGVMGDIPQSTWLPTLPIGTTLGPKPASLAGRYVALYKKFASAWRVTDQTSLFVYAPGTSTATFSDPNWPPKSGPCKVNRKFGSALAKPAGPTINPAKAERICALVTVKKLHVDCVFDVSATGDPKVAQSYLQAQELALRATTIRVDGDKETAPAGTVVTFSATVAPLSAGRPTPTGTATLLIDGKTATAPVALDKRGRARVRMKFRPGVHQIMAGYTPGKPRAGDVGYLSSTSPIVLHTALSLEGSSVRAILNLQRGKQFQLVCPIWPAKATSGPANRSQTDSAPGVRARPYS